MGTEAFKTRPQVHRLLAGVEGKGKHTVPSSRPEAPPTLSKPKRTR